MEPGNKPQESDQQDNSFIKSTMTFGLYAGLALIIYTLLLYATDNLLRQNFLLSLINYLILIGGIVIGIRSYRDQILGGYISYGNALGYGVVMSIFMGIILGIFTYLLYTVIDPQLMEESMNMIEEEMLNQGISPDQVESLSEMQRKIRTPFMMLVGSVLTYTLLGFIFSLVIAAFLKNDKPLFSQ